MDGPPGTGMRRTRILLHGITRRARVTTGVVVASHGPRWLTGSAAPLTSRPRSPGARVHCACSPPSVAGPMYRDPITYTAGSQLAPVPRADLTHDYGRAVNVDAGRTEMRSSGMETDQPAEQQIARLTLLAEARYLPAALAVVREAAAAVGLAAADVTALDRAVEEVASNVIEHGFEPGQRATFDLVVLRRPGQLVVAIEDAGLPFDFSDLEVGQGSSLAAPSLAEFADEIRFSSLGARGNRVEIVKRLPFTPIDALGADPKPAAPPGPPVL